MLIDGPRMSDDQRESNYSAAVLAISQLLGFNAVKARNSTNQSSHQVRHNRNRETPAAIYLGVKIHAETIKKTLIDTLHNIGLCISYNRILVISTESANAVCETFEKEGVVCPPKLLNNVFTTAAVDNIDHNPSSTTATDSFHGTGISIMQYPADMQPGIQSTGSSVD